MVFVKNVMKQKLNLVDIVIYVGLHSIGAYIYRKRNTVVEWIQEGGAEYQRV